MNTKEQSVEGRKILLYVIAVLMLLLGVFAADATKRTESVITVMTAHEASYAKRASSDEPDDSFKDDTTISVTGLS